MGLSVAGTAAILISGLLIASTLVFTVIEYRDKVTIDAQREQVEYTAFNEHSRISIIDAGADSVIFIKELGKWRGNIVICLKNIGSTTFDLNKLNILVNGSIVSTYIDKNNITVSGNNTFFLSPNSTAVISVQNCYFDETIGISTRVAATMENGITAYYTIADKTPIADAGLKYRYVEDNETIRFDASRSLDCEVLFQEWYDILYNTSNNNIDRVGGGLTGYYWDFDGNNDSDGDGNLTNDCDAKGKVVDYIFHARDLDNDGVSDPYIVTLTVKDAKGRTDTETIVVYVLDRTPPKIIKNFLVANKTGVISNDQPLGDALTFNATDSVSDNVGYVQSANRGQRIGIGLYFAWDFNGDGFIDTNFTRYPTSQYVYTKPQCPYNVTLFVKDADNNILSYTQYLNITKLTPDFVFTPSVIWEGDTVTFDATPSENTFYGVVEPYTDANGNGIHDANEPYIDVNGNGGYDGLIYTWDFDDNTDANGDTILDNDVDATGTLVTHVYTRTLSVGGTSNAAGKFVITLKIMDANGNSGVVKHDITIGDKTPPVILQQNDRTVALGTTSTFYVNTDDNSNQEVVCYWLFGDGTAYRVTITRGDTNPSLNYNFTTPGEYVVMLTALDATGNRASSRFVVTVTP